MLRIGVCVCARVPCLSLNWRVCAFLHNRMLVDSDMQLDVCDAHWYMYFIVFRNLAHILPHVRRQQWHTHTHSHSLGGVIWYFWELDAVFVSWSTKNAGRGPMMDRSQMVHKWLMAQTISRAMSISSTLLTGYEYILVEAKSTSGPGSKSLILNLKPGCKFQGEFLLRCIAIVRFPKSRTTPPNIHARTYIHMESVWWFRLIEFVSKVGW